MSDVKGVKANHSKVRQARMDHPVVVERREVLGIITPDELSSKSMLEIAFEMVGITIDNTPGDFSAFKFLIGREQFTIEHEVLPDDDFVTEDAKGF